MQLDLYDATAVEMVPQVLVAIGELLQHQELGPEGDWATVTARRGENGFVDISIDIPICANGGFPATVALPPVRIDDQPIVDELKHRIRQAYGASQRLRDQVQIIVEGPCAYKS